MADSDWAYEHCRFLVRYWSKGSWRQSGESPHTNIADAQRDAEEIVREKRAKVIIYEKIETVDLAFTHTKIDRLKD